MKVNVTLNLQSSNPEEGQGILREIFDKLMTDNTISEYSFEILTGADIVTDRCIFSQGNVIA